MRSECRRSKRASAHIDPRREHGDRQELKTGGAATLLLDWFRVCLRHGWLGSHRTRNTEQPVRRNDKGAIERLGQTRQKLGLNRCYGAMAVFAGAAEETVPIRHDDPGGG